ncbi:MAG TPA: acyl-CoA desaturase [Rhabdochlamydiaceae bacterium]|nr:acyl-CoA desaturase [Rhabdochlamydiaceae bacterium]
MNVELKKVSFHKDESCDFISTLRKKINHYFKDCNLSPKANFSMYFKTIFFVCLMALTYIAILKGLGGALGVFGLYILLGFFISVGGMNIAHDALHGSYTSFSWGNPVLGLFMDLFGASSFYWRKEHTVDHHTFTNIAEHDADLDVPILIRLCPKAPHRPFHRFQHFYAPFLYSLKFMHWIFFSDMKRIVKIFKEKPKSPGKTDVFLLITFKVLHFFLFLILPIIYLSFPWWQVALCYLAFLGTAGIIMTTIFQLAHIVENVAFPLPNVSGKIENSFFKHQLATTSNFAMNNKLVGFLFGGLNFQIEHHLFPHICHTHLRKISSIVQSTAKEFGIPYHHHSSFFAALKSHFKTLKVLGRSPESRSV